MNKSELIDAVAEQANISKSMAGRTLGAVLQTITESLLIGDDVVLTGFGTFTIKDRAARIGTNPQTGEPITIAAARVPGFRAGRTLKDAVN